MKTMFIEARYNEKIKIPIKLIDALPEKTALFTTVQFIKAIPEIEKQIKSVGKKVILLKPRHSEYPGQLLGCGTEKFNESFDAFLYIGDGVFHPQALLIKNSKKVFVYNPFSKKHKVIDESYDATIRMRKHFRAGLLKFHASTEIGVIVSVKPGQFQLENAKKTLSKFKDKNFYFIAFDNIDFSQLENFNFIECFVNTACPRISYEDFDKFPKPVINFDEII